MRLTDFLFKGADFVSIYGREGTGKTSIAVQVSRELSPAYYISTEGQVHLRLMKARLGEKGIIAYAFTPAELRISLAQAVEVTDLSLIVVDTMNSAYRQTWDLRDLYLPLAFLKSVSEKGVKVLAVWETSANNKVAGEKLMRAYSDRVLRVTGRFILGNNEYCEYRVTGEGVLGCL